MEAEFVSEPIEFAGDAVARAGGVPVLPERIRWRDEEIAVSQVIEEWKDTGPCTHGSGERYLRKHWYRVRTADGREMKIYFERKARSNARKRWWLYTITPAE